MVEAYEVLEDAKLIGVQPGTNLICVWAGGYSFNEYSSRNWKEVNHFTCGTGTLAEGQATEEEMKNAAQEQMEEKGYEVIR